MRIIKYPHPTLRHESKPVTRVDQPLKDMIGRMFELMYEGNGIGLAANQVDLPYRLLVMNVECDPAATDQEYVFINPEITHRKGSAQAEEGCLSFPGIYAPVRRSAKVVVSAYSLQGKELSYELDGLYARVAQHEIDHLDGVVFIDHLGTSARLAVKQGLADLEQQFHTDRRLGLIPDDDEIATRLAELEEVRT